MSLIVGLLLMLLSAHFLGRLAEMLRQPALVGQMFAGIVLGPSILGWVQAAPNFAAISDLSVLFVVITAGLEMRMQHVLDLFRGKGVFALLLGFAIPALSAGVFCYWMGLALIPGLVVTLCLSVTALPVALRILGSFGMLNTQIARVAIASALLSDVIVLMALGVALALATSNASSNTSHWLPVIGLAIAKLGGLLVLVGVCHYVCLRLSERMASAQSKDVSPKHPADSVMILTLLFMLGLGAASEHLGFHFAIGVFFASLMITRDLISDVRFENLERTCELMTVSLFGPLFLAYQGIQFKLGSIENASFMIGLVIVAIGSKLLGGYAVARLKQLSQRESLGVAAIMNARGVMEMVVASIAYRAGLVDQGLFSALLLVGIVTTMITPLLLKQWVPNLINQKNN
jgi:Kef-type K+ transport system membrane component KefB